MNEEPGRVSSSRAASCRACGRAPRWPVLAVVALSCGRGGFEPIGDRPVRPQDAASADGDSDTPSDLLFHATFEGDVGDVAGGRTPTCIGCPLAFTSSPGNAGQALQLTGAECLEYADDPRLRPVSFTLAAWFRVSQAATFSMFGKAFEADATEQNSYEFWVSSAGQVLFATVNATDPYVWADSIVPTTWYHVAGTMDGGTKRIYVDGVERMVGSPGATAYDGESLRIGCDRGTGNVQNFFVGDLDDVRLYGRALAAAEIAALAATPP